jgi:hypothetical protein
MKKNYIYFLAPVGALIIFTAVYMNFLSGYEKKEETRTLAIKQKKLEKIKADDEATKLAYDQAIAAQALRKKEKEAKEAKDQSDRDARQLAEDNRAQARRDEEKLAEKARSLAKDVDAVKKEIAELDDNKKKAGDEEAFLRVYVKQAEANRTSLMAVLDQIQKADDAAAAAAKAAALAAKK